MLPIEDKVTSTTDKPKQFPETGEEIFNLSPQELQEAWGQCTLPSDERETRKCFEKIASARFELYPEIQIRMPFARPIRIDYIGLDRSGQVQGTIGFEIKSPKVIVENYNDFSSAIAQAVDYSKGIIQTGIAQHQELHERMPRWVFVFPCPYRVYEFRNGSVALTQRDHWAQGTLKLSGLFGVGAIHYDPKQADWGCFLAGHPAFWMKTGPTYLATRHSKSGTLGSGR